MAKSISLFIPLALASMFLSGCYSMRDEYAYRASLNVKNHNQLPYVYKVRELDGTDDRVQALTALRTEHDIEQGSFLFVTPRSY